jgi:hypothetical protein
MSEEYLVIYYRFHGMTIGGIALKLDMPIFKVTAIIRTEVNEIESQRRQAGLPIFRAENYLKYKPKRK